MRERSGEMWLTGWAVETNESTRATRTMVRRFPTDAVEVVRRRRAWQDDEYHYDSPTNGPNSPSSTMNDPLNPIPRRATATMAAVV